LKTDFVPTSAKDFAGPCGSQNCKLKGTGGYTLTGPQGSHDRTDLGVWECGMMLNLTHLAARRQQDIEVPAPARGVFALPKTSNLRPIQYPLYSTAHSGGRLGFG
jgi:hypothetical protein